MSETPSTTEKAPQTLTLTEFLAWMFDLEEDGRARTLRDMAEPLRAQGFGLVADHLEGESARVLAEVGARRRIVESEGAPYAAGHTPPTRTLRLLASVYSDHPQFREEWRA